MPNGTGIKRHCGGSLARTNGLGGPGRHLTEAGRALHGRVMPLFEAREREVLACLDADEQVVLDRLLTRLPLAVPVER
jgi:hypothetical protein